MSAIGAQVEVQYGAHKHAQAVLAQSSFYSVNDRRLHFGLGPHQEAEVRVRWPNGSTVVFTSLPANRLIIIREGEGEARSEALKKHR